LFSQTVNYEFESLSFVDVINLRVCEVDRVQQTDWLLDELFNVVCFGFNGGAEMRKKIDLVYVVFVCFEFVQQKDLYLLLLLAV